MKTRNRDDRYKYSETKRIKTKIPRPLARTLLSAKSRLRNILETNGNTWKPIHYASGKQR